MFLNVPVFLDFPVLPLEIFHEIKCTFTIISAHIYESHLPLQIMFLHPFGNYKFQLKNSPPVQRECVP